MSFDFLDPGTLRDGELEVVLVGTRDAIPERKRVPSYRFELRIAGRVIGDLNFRAAMNEDIERYSGNIGYGVHPEYSGHHYAERGTRLILPFVRRHGLRAIWLTCHPDNGASRRTCERLGAVLVEIVDLPRDHDERREKGEHQKCRYRLEV